MVILTGLMRKLCNRIAVRMIKSRKIRWAGHVAKVKGKIVPSA
jgi:hypothetical protein